MFFVFVNVRWHDTTMYVIWFNIDLQIKIYCWPSTRSEVVQWDTFHVCVLKTLKTDDNKNNVNSLWLIVLLHSNKLMKNAYIAVSQKNYGMKNAFFQIKTHEFVERRLAGHFIYPINLRLAHIHCNIKFPYTNRNAIRASGD